MQLKCTAKHYPEIHKTASSHCVFLWALSVSWCTISHTEMRSPNYSTTK